MTKEDYEKFDLRRLSKNQKIAYQIIKNEFENYCELRNKVENFCDKKKEPIEFKRVENYFTKIGAMSEALETFIKLRDKYVREISIIPLVVAKSKNWIASMIIDDIIE